MKPVLDGFETRLKLIKFGLWREHPLGFQPGQIVKSLHRKKTMYDSASNLKT